MDPFGGNYCFAKTRKYATGKKEFPGVLQKACSRVKKEAPP